ncbi:MAG: dihydropteroate synthase-like protein [Thermoprotei archaeon]
MFMIAENSLISNLLEYVGSIMRMLLVTGIIAEGYVRREAEILSKLTGYKVDVLTLRLPVAALASTNYIAEALLRANVRDYDIVIIPGLARGSASIISERMGIPCVKGPKHFADISKILSTMKIEKLSGEIPADMIYEGEVSNEISQTFSMIEKSIVDQMFIIAGKVKIPLRPPPIRVISEITEAHLYDRNKLLQEIIKRVEAGADIVSVGFDASNPMPDLVYSTIRFIKENYDVPIAVDSMAISEIKAGINAGSDMILNLDAGTISDISSIPGSVAVVLIPTNMKENFVPRSVDERLKLIDYLLSKAREKKIENVIIDPIIEPPINPGLLTGLETAIELKKRKILPMMIGISNVTEMIDADSVGINALLTVLAYELGVSAVLVVEKSHKAKGSTREVVTASKMVTLAHVRRTYPKDLGVNLLILKEKSDKTVPINVDSSTEIFSEHGFGHTNLDPQGFFKIGLDRDRGLIIAVYQGRKGSITIKGATADAVAKKIIDLGLISRLDHAAYIGMELQKAETALRLNKSYVQDESLPLTAF